MHSAALAAAVGATWGGWAWSVPPTSGSRQEGGSFSWWTALAISLHLSGVNLSAGADLQTQVGRQAA